jgi:hypothetical protein
MMRLRLTPLFLIALVGSATLADAQVWERQLAQGLVYRMEVDLSVPRIIHALRWNPRSEVQAVPELAGGVVYSDGPTRGRETMTSLVRRTGALAGINADFFPFTGDPLGLMVRNGELVSTPYRTRAVLAWGPESAAVGLAGSTLTYSVDGGARIAIDGFNQECPNNRLVLNTQAAGIAAAKQPNMHVLIRLEEGEWTPNGRAAGVVRYLIPEGENVKIEPGNVVLTAMGTRMRDLLSLRPGQRIEFEVAINGFDWSLKQNAVGGGPFLLRNGQSAVDAAAQGFDAAFANRRHPRTAAGRAANGDLWFVAVDGRQKVSEGATLAEMAQIMLRLGCVDAINLDGGGSTTLNVLGMTVNRPSEGSERAVANGVVFYGPGPQANDAQYQILVPVGLMEGESVQLMVQAADGQVIPAGDILWSATGAGWIDQSGTLRTLSAGATRVSALVRGQIVRMSLEVAAAQPASRGGGARGGRGGGN